MKYLKAGLVFSLTAVLFYLMQNPPGLPMVPGDFLNPFAGFWQNNEAGDELPVREHLKGLRDSVIVLWDDRHVPHIFAGNDYDLYFAQGYLTARDRLWQMEFQVFASAGRLSEIFGARTLEYDRFRRRIGIMYAAENALKAMEEDPRMREVVEAYTAGVNAWIEQLDPAEYPVEYKIFDYRPEPWTPLKCALLLKYMAWRLSGYNEELPRSRARAVLGDSVADQLYFRETPLAQPIIPPGTPWNFQPLASPTPPPSFFTPIPLAELEPVPPDAAVGGSNNWAVSGAKTASGYPILCNDPHLSFSLPSVWYEIQLASPNVNVYGVSLPGAPAVIIGFNENIAWGVTNTETDVLDWYRIRFRDDRRREYYYDGKWQPTTFRVETIRVRGQEAVIDSIPFTHHGPVVYRATEKPFDENIPVGMALRWTGHDPSRELKSFVLLNRAKNYPDFVEAISYFDCPGQNFAFADREGNIAIHHNGKFPLRWEKQGRYISDGADPAYDWADWIPREQVPQVKNPPQGFVQSANQKPVDKTYPYYLGGHYAGFERGRRIHERLAEMERITPEDMMELQRDILNVHARTVLPTLLRILAQADLSLAEVRDYEILRHWDYRQRRDAIAPTIFEAFWEDLTEQIWEDEMSAGERPLLWPTREVTLDLLLHDTTSIFFDDRRTPSHRETREEVVIRAFQRTHQRLTETYGAFDEQWRWGKTHGTDILHLARLPGFGVAHLETDGNEHIVNATARTHGPSWRMIVEMGPEVRAWGIYPGGQSGNPGSRYYANTVQDWVEGRYYPLLYFRSPEDVAAGEIAGRTVLLP